MKGWEKILIFMIIVFASFLITYKWTINVKTNKFIHNMHTLCGVLTDELNSQVTENSTCQKYYCYYSPYAPPKGYENKTTSLCACQCKLKDGSIRTIQVLGSV